jgi:RNA polymerase sigma factor (sigma-70 family)
MENTDIQNIQKPVADLRVAFIKLTEPYREALWRYCYKITGNALDAEDLVQDTLLRAFAKLGYLGQALNPKAYLFKMATHIWIRQQERRRELQEVDDVQESDGPVELPFELGEVMEWLITLLPPKQRVVFLLSTAFDFTNKEIAELMGTSEGTIKSYLHRARATINEAIVEYKPANTQTVILGTTDNPLLQRYITAFNAGNAEGLLALLDEQTTTRIIGDWEEYGKEQTKNYSLHYWAQEKIYREARFGLLDGVPVIFGFRKNESGETCLREVIRLVHDDNVIHTMDWYFFSVDLIRYAAARLDLPYMVQGYQYENSSLK